MGQEMKEEQCSDYNLNTSDKKSYYNSSPDKKSFNSSPERSRSKRSRKDRSYSYTPSPPSYKKSRRDRSNSSCDSKSPTSYKRIRYHGSREHPNKSRVLGVFGLSSRTIEDDLVDIFSYYGPIEDVRIIYDAKSGNSRGFGFIYYHYVDDASIARRKCNGMRLNGKRIRVDYSITKRAHTPTPGVYMGNRYSSKDRYYSDRRIDTSYGHHSARHHRSRSTSR